MTGIPPDTTFAWLVRYKGLAAWGGLLLYSELVSIFGEEWMQYQLPAPLSIIKKQDQKLVSEFGKYQGYTQKVYDGYSRASDFLALSDGTRLAYDVYLPTKKGVPAIQPFPVLFMYTPYGRTRTIFDEQGKNNLAPLIEMKWYENLAVRVLTWLAPEKNRVDALLTGP